MILNSIGLPRLELPKQEDRKFCHLDEYYKIAKKQINYFGRRKYPNFCTKLQQSHELLADVVNANIMADWQYDDTRGMTLRSYRNTRALFVIKTFIIRLRNEVKVSSLNRPLKKDQTREVQDLLPAKLIPYVKDEVLRILSFVGEREKQILSLYYIEAFTYDEIAEVYKISKERVRQIMDKALATIKYRVNNGEETSETTNGETGTKRRRSNRRI